VVERDDPPLAVEDHEERVDRIEDRRGELGSLVEDLDPLRLRVARVIL